MHALFPFEKSRNWLRDHDLPVNWPVCPHCLGVGIEPGFSDTECSFCDGKRKVSPERMSAYKGWRKKI